MTDLTPRAITVLCMLCAGHLTAAVVARRLAISPAHSRDLLADMVVAGLVNVDDGKITLAQDGDRWLYANGVVSPTPVYMGTHK